MIQVQTINYILTTKDKEFIEENNLTSSLFKGYETEFNFIKNHLNIYGQVPDVSTFKESFPNFEISNVEESPKYLLTELNNDYNQSILTTELFAIRDLINEGKIEEAVNRFQNPQQAFSCIDLVKPVDIINDTSRYDEYIEKTKNLSRFYVPTGFKELDRVIQGFDREGEIATIVARPGVGKSWCLLKFASYSAQLGLKVGIYSGEMAANKVATRMDTLIGNINNGAINHGNISIRDEYKEYMDKLPDMIKGSIKVITPAQMGDISPTVDFLGSFIDREKLDILYIDQLSLLEDQRKGKSFSECFSNISKDIVKLQKKKKIPIISVSQQNRTKDEEEGVGTRQISGSDRIGQDSTLVLFLEKKDNVFKLSIAKSRYSESNLTLTYDVDLNKGIFTYIPDENDANNGESDEDYENRYSTDGEELFD